MNLTKKKLPPAIDVNHLTVQFSEKVVLWDLSFTLNQGECIGILGPNGAGKSTLLKALIGTHCSPEGTVSFQGESFKKNRKKIAYLPQKSNIDWSFPITPLEVVLMGLYPLKGYCGWMTRADKAHALKMLERLGLSDYADQPLHILSGGQRQRVFMARALIQNPDIYLLDEPFAGVDLPSQQLIINLLKKLTGDGKTVLIVHHDLMTAQSLFDTILWVNKRLIECGSVSEVFNLENMQKTFGAEDPFLEKLFYLSQKKKEGV